MKFSLAILFFTPVALAVDIILWSGDCGNFGRYVCQDWPAGPGGNSCCQGGRPFCGRASCEGCRTGNDLYSFSVARCYGESYAVCRVRDFPGPVCCIPLGGGRTCAAQWFVGNAPGRESIQDEEDMLERQRLEDGTTVETFEDGLVLRTSVDGNVEECAWTTQPQRMVYVDGKGVEQNKFLPLGFMERAGELYMAEDWDELAKFPEFNGQGPHKPQLRTVKEIDAEAREPAKL